MPVPIPDSAAEYEHAAHEHRRAGRLDDARHSFGLALSAYEAVADRRGAVSCREGLGRVALDADAKTEAVEHFLDACDGHLGNGDEIAAARCAFRASGLLVALNRVEEAHPLLVRHLGTLLAHADRLFPRAKVLYLVGVVERRAGRATDAMEYLDLAGEAFRRDGDEHGARLCDTSVAYCEREAAWTLLEGNLFAEAIVLFASAREVFAVEGDEAQIADCDLGRGTAELAMGDRDAARVHLERAKALFQLIGNSSAVERADVQLRRLDTSE